MRTIIVLSLFVTGCAQGKWYHATATQEQWNKDRLECEYDASKATAGVASGIQAGYEKGSLMRMCLQTRGYYWQAD